MRWSQPTQAMLAGAYHREIQRFTEFFLLLWIYWITSTHWVKGGLVGRIYYLISRDDYSCMFRKGQKAKEKWLFCSAPSRACVKTSIRMSWFFLLTAFHLFVLKLFISPILPCDIFLLSCIRPYSTKKISVKKI